MPERPKVGLGVMIIKDGKILLGKRRAEHGHGTWCPPGGHLEYGESFEECAARETMEEAGIKIGNVQFSTITNDVFEESGKHYITIHMLAEHICDKEPCPMIPDEVEKWGWFDWDEMPENMFLPSLNLRKAGYRPDGI